MKLREITEKEFEKFAAKCPVRNFYQCLEMWKKYQKNGTEAYLTGLFDGKKMCAAALIISRHTVKKWKVFESPRGFLMDYSAKNAGEVFEAMSREVAAFLKKRSGMTLMITPNVSHIVETDEKGAIKPESKYSSGVKDYGSDLFSWAKKAGYKSLGEYGIGKWMYILPIGGKTPEEIYKNFKERHRRSTRYATERYGVRLRKLSKNELKLYQEIIHMTGERRGFGEPGMDYYNEMYDAQGDKVEFVVVEMPKSVIDAYEIGDKADVEKARAEAAKVLGDDVWIKKQNKVEMVPVAAGMFLFNDLEAVYLYGGSVAEYKKFGGPHLMQYEMMKKGLEWGASRYNFYGMVPEPGDGVYEFKRGFNGQVEEYVGAFIMPLNMVGKLYVARRTYAEIRHVE